MRQYSPVCHRLSALSYQPDRGLPAVLAGGGDEPRQGLALAQGCQIDDLAVARARTLHEAVRPYIEAADVDRGGVATVRNHSVTP
jgi:hypothetical protein